jgi:hypothetical protein
MTWSSSPEGQNPRFKVSVEPSLAHGQIEDRRAGRDVDGVAERELDVAVAARRREVVARTSRVGAREDHAVQRLLGQLLKRQLQSLEVIIGVVGAGVPGPQDRSQRFAATRHEQRVKAEQRKWSHFSTGLDNSLSLRHGLPGIQIAWTPGTKGPDFYWRFCI